MTDDYFGFRISYGGYSCDHAVVSTYCAQDDFCSQNILSRGCCGLFPGRDDLYMKHILFCMFHDDDKALAH